MLRGEDIICVSSIDWDFNWQAHQEIMSIFANNENRVLFIENTGVRKPTLRDLSRIKKRIINWRKGFYGIRRERENIYIYSPIVLPFPYSNLAKIINRFLFINIVKKWIRAMNFNNPIIWTFLPNVMTLDLIDHINKKLVIYYCLDNFALLTDNPKKLEKIESSLVKRSDIVFTSSETLSSRWKKVNSNCYAFPVGIPSFLLNTSEANSFSLPDDMKVAKPIIGYIGGIHKWVDLGLIETIAKAKPHWSLVFVGPIQCGISRLKSISNIYFLGKKNYRVLPQYINFFDVCLLPYKPSDFSNVAYPTKLIIYLAMGKPVVAYSTRELKQFGDLIYFADEASSFIRQIEFALDENNSELVKRRVQKAKENIWDDKIEQMSILINDKIDRQRLVKDEKWKEKLQSFYKATRKRLIQIGIVCLLGYLIFFKTPFMWFLAEPLKISQSPRPADTIVVFAGGVGESGQAGQGYEERVGYAVELYKRGYAKYMIFSSGYMYAFKEPLVMKALAVSLGVSEEAIILEHKAKNTYENVMFTEKILADKGWDEILLISSPYHMRRVSLVAKKITRRIKIIYTPIPKSRFYSHGIGPNGEKVWKQINVQQIRGLMHEYLGIVYYWWKGYI